MRVVVASDDLMQRDRDFGYAICRFSDIEWLTARVAEVASIPVSRKDVVVASPESNFMLRCVWDPDKRRRWTNQFDEAILSTLVYESYRG